MMEFDADAIITRRDIDAMADEELLPFARKHSLLLGERFGRPESFYAPELLDEPYFLRRLCLLDREQFTRLTQEQNRREYIAGGRWAAVLLSQGGTLPEDVLKKQEWAMRTAPALDIVPDRNCDSALFLEVSEKARELWAAQPALYKSRWDQCRQLAHVLRLRAKWLGSSHTDSAKVLYRLNWKPLDIMLAYLIGETTESAPAIDPDCAVDAARQDPEAAVWLLNPDHYRAYFEGQFHPSYDQDMAKVWAELLYFHGNWQDRSPLEKGHRLKRMNAFYFQKLEWLRDPGWPRRSLEDDLRKTGLLPSNAPPDWTYPKLAKRQRLALTRALVCQYLWRTPDLLAALSASKDSALFTSLVWGFYQEDHLAAAFLLDASGTAWGEDGQPMSLPPDGQIGLVTPMELDKKQLSVWKKRLKEAGAKQPIRQLTLPVVLPDFGAFEGVVTKHITIYSTAGKWGLDMGVLPRRCRADLLDPLHGYGARIWFDDVWDGPEYSGDEVTVLGVEFYRMDPIPFQDCLPRRAVISPETLPLRFTSIAGAAFRQLAGT